jgi:cellulose synthase (UDP-forming)
MLAGLWQGIVGSEGQLFRLLRLLLWVAFCCWGALFITLPLAWQPQIVLGVVMVIGGVLIGRVSLGPMATIALMILSLFATLRYAWWRIGAVVAFFSDPSNRWDWADAACICILLSAEAYAFIVLFLGFMQTVWPLRRPPVPLPADESEWPHVDLLIPTYNEPLSVVRYTAMASLNIDWPADKLHIYILDDGKREAFREFAEEAGIGYRTRSDNAHAKAGNINRSLAQLDSPFVAIFDCDHLPTRSFLQVTMGWFLREQRLAMVQTPHHFYSADPFERNLKQFRLIPNEGELFYGVVQDGNDFWNAAFFCGSCAVLRRTALDEIGGIAVETVTEDAHTSLRMQMRGWSTAYINIPQAAGLATERLSGHIQQRVRWARGMIQILRTDNPLFAKGLRFAQRICYFNAMTHFLYAVPRLIFLTAPLVYLFFSRSNIPGLWIAILAYAMPHLVLSNVTNSRIQGQHRHSFWNEIYETVLSPYILLPTITALINPKLGKFNVTAKGGFVEETYFDGRIATPFVVLLLLNFCGLLMVIPRMIVVPGMERFWDGTHQGTIAMNALWCVFNIIILGVAITVAREEVQRREHVRIDFMMPVRLRSAQATLFSGQTEDISIGGAAITLPEIGAFHLGDLVKVLLPLRIGDAEMPATVVGIEGRTLRVQFQQLSLFDEELLTTILYSRADAWLNWGDTREKDRPLRSFYRILKLSLRGMGSTLAMLFPRRKPAVKPAAAGRAALWLLAALALGAAGVSAHGSTRRRASPAVTPSGIQSAAGSVAPIGSSFAYTVPLSELGQAAPLELRGLDSSRSVAVVLPRDQVVEHASLHLAYRFSSAAKASGRLRVMLNGTPLTVLQAPVDGSDDPIQVDLPLPAELLVHNNTLRFEFQGRQSSRCDARLDDQLWARISPASALELSGQTLVLASDLHDLPLPWLDQQIARNRSIPMVLAARPSRMAMQAAGVIASYFGEMAQDRLPRFPVSFDRLPQGNIIVLVEGNDAALLSALAIDTPTMPTVTVRANPSDSTAKALVIAGADGDQLLQAAQALAVPGATLQGTSMNASGLILPAPRAADDAPRWAHSEGHALLWRADEGASRDSDGSSPTTIFLRVPPDLYTANRSSIPLYLEYRTTGGASDDGRTLLLHANGALIGTIPVAKRGAGGSTVHKVEIPLPVADLRPFSNSLTVDWIAKQPGCAVRSQANSGHGFLGSILGSSYLNLTGLAHWTAMPNLELFANAGYPFTRYADLNQTTVVLPDQPSPQSLELYFTLLAYFGAQTGYPALRVAVAGPADLHPGLDNDLLLVGSATNEPWMQQVNTLLPVRIDGDQLELRQAPGMFAHLRQLWRTVQRALDGHGFNEAPSLPDQAPAAMLQAAASPFAPKRAVVAFEARDDASDETLIQAFLKAAPSSQIAGDVALLDGSTFHSLQVEPSAYAIGERPWLIGLKATLMQNPWDSVLGLLLFSILAAARIQVRLQRMATIRLHQQEGTA